MRASERTGERACYTFGSPTTIDFPNRTPEIYSYDCLRRWFVSRVWYPQPANRATPFPQNVKKDLKKPDTIEESFTGGNLTDET